MDCRNMNGPMDDDYDYDDEDIPEEDLPSEYFNPDERPRKDGPGGEGY